MVAYPRSRRMYFWTFFVFIGNGRFADVKQVSADNLGEACSRWAQVVEIEEFISNHWRQTETLPSDAEDQFVGRADLKGVWCWHCTFGIADDEMPEEWGGNYPTVWVVKTRR